MRRNDRFIIMSYLPQEFLPKETTPTAGQIKYKIFVNYSRVGSSSTEYSYETHTYGCYEGGIVIMIIKRVAARR